MRNSEKAKNYNDLYRKQHFIAIAIKNRMYKNLPHIKERRRQENQRRLKVKVNSIATARLFSIPKTAIRLPAATPFLHILSPVAGASYLNNG